MTSPLMRAVGDSRSGRRGLAMAFAFLLFAGTSLPGRAAEDDPYSATVKVDASSDVIGKARDAWAQRPPAASGGTSAATGAVQFTVPLGDAGDIAVIDAAKARAGNAVALANIAQQNGGDEAIVALAALSGTADKPGALEVT